MSLNKNFEYDTSRTAPDVWNSSPDKGYFNQFGFEQNEMTMDDQRRYKTNVFNSVFKASPRKSPTWTLLTSTKREKLTAPMMSWTEDFNGEKIEFNNIDGLRFRVYEDQWDGDHNKDGGKLFFTPVGVAFDPDNLSGYTATPGTAAALPLADTAEELKVAQLDSIDSAGKYMFLGFNRDSNTLTGKVAPTVRHWARILESLQFKKADGNGIEAKKVDFGSGEEEVFWYEYDPKNGSDLDFIFNTLAYATNVGGTKSYFDDFTVVAMISHVVINKARTKFLIAIDMGNTKLENLDDTATNNYILVEGFNSKATYITTDLEGSHTAKGYNVANPFADIDGGNTIISQYWEYDRNYATADAHSEIDAFDVKTIPSSSRMKVYKHNNMQTFMSDTWAQTVISQMTSYGPDYENDAMKNVIKQTDRYTRKLANTTLFGKASIEFVNGYPIAKMGGLFDAELFPIEVLRIKLPTAVTGNGQEWVDFFDTLGSTLASENYIPGEAKPKFQLSISKTIKTRMNRAFQLLRTQPSTVGGSYFGNLMVTAKSDPISTMGIAVDEVETEDAFLNFIVEPMFEIAQSLPIDDYRFDTKPNPRHLAFQIAYENITIGTMRPDTMYQGLQNNNQRNVDLAAIMGDHSMKVVNPRASKIIHFIL